MISDAAERQRALSVDASFIVQAPAGSGKTDLLIRRVLTLLARVDSPEEILAITFTRKAAAEMRERIHSMLQAAAQGVQVEDAHEAAGIELAQRVLQRNDSEGWGLLENPQRLGMQTIDSLCASLTRQLPVTSSLGAPLATEEIAQPMYLAAAGRLIERALTDNEQLGASTRELLLEFDNKVQRLQLMLSSMLANRDQWLRYIGHANEREALQESINVVVTRRLQSIANAAPDIFSPEFFELAAHADYCMRELSDDERFAAIASCAELPGADVADGEAWVSLRHLLLTAAGTVRKSLTKKAGFPVAKADATELGLEKSTLDDRKRRFTECLSALDDNDEFVKLIARVDRLPFAGYTDQQWEILQHLSILLIHTVAELHVSFGQSGKCDFSEVSQRASTALGDSENPTDLALVMDYRIRHILVDEFQDTSISQFDLFEQMIAGWEEGDGRTFFAVGDPMQSIYRFRDAEVSLFTQARYQGIANVSLEHLQLEVNFRSDPALVNWCNNTFSQIFPEQPNVVAGAVSFAPSTAFKPSDPGSAQQSHFFVGEHKGKQAVSIVDILRQQFDDYPDQSAAVLVRSKNHLAEIFQALRAAGIACQAVEMEALGSRPVVRDIRQLCDALMHPSNRVAWLGLLRAPWCGLDLKELHELVELDRNAPLWDVIEKVVGPEVAGEQTCISLSEESRKRLESFADIMRPAVRRAVREEVMVWVEACWLQLAGPAVCVDKADLDAANTAFTALLALESQGLLWDRAVVEMRMQQLFAPAAVAEGPQVQIMTIHKSKGLEFDTVILPNLGHKTGNDSQSLLNWFELVDDDGESRLLLAPLNTATELYKTDAIYRLIKSFHDEREINERIRLMYVAATRARKRLHVLAHSKLAADGEIADPQPGSLLQTLWPVVSDEFVEQVQVRESVDEEVFDEEASVVSASDSTDGTVPSSLSGIGCDTAASNLKRLVADWQIPVELQSFQWFAPSSETGSVVASAADTEPPEFQWAGMDAASIGTVVHRQLQRICDEGINNWPLQKIDQQDNEYRLSLKLSGVSESNLDECLNRVKRGLRRCLQDQRGQWLLDSSHKDSRTELALSTINESGEVEQVVLDRIFIDSDGVRWIIDYKTGDHRGGAVEDFLDRELERYRPQLQNYAGIVKKMWPESSARLSLGLYFPLLQGWRQWDA